MRLVFAALAGFLAFGLGQSARAETRLPQHFRFQSLFGTYDKASLQTGFAVYQANCASCHGLDLVHYRDLGHLGLSPQDVAAIVSQIKVRKGADAAGKPVMVPATPRDAFQPPFPNEAAAEKKFHGAVPPDLSLVEAGHRDGADYVYSLLMGYRPVPSDVSLLPYHYYNAAFPGGQIAMAPALKPGSVTLADGKKPSVQVMAHDVAEFLAWTADPALDERKAVGLRIIIFLLSLGVIGGFAIRAGRRA